MSDNALSQDVDGLFDAHPPSAYVVAQARKRAFLEGDGDADAGDGEAAPPVAVSQNIPGPKERLPDDPVRAPQGEASRHRHLSEFFGVEPVTVGVHGEEFDVFFPAYDIREDNGFVLMFVDTGDMLIKLKFLKSYRLTLGDKKIDVLGGVSVARDKWGVVELVFFPSTD